MSEDTTIPLPGGWSFKIIKSSPKLCFLANPDGAFAASSWWIEEARAFADAMNAAQATVPPSRGDEALAEALRPFAAAYRRFMHYGGQPGDGAALYASRAGGVLYELLDGPEGKPVRFEHLRAADEALATHPGAAGQDAKIITALKIAANDPDVGTHSDAIFDGLHLIARLYEQCATSTGRQDGSAGQPVSGSGVTEIDANGEAMVCTGCGTTKTVAWMRSQGAMTCCPERKLVPVREMWSAAPTPPATASSGAAVAVSVEDVERLVDELAQNAFTYGYVDGQVRPFDIKNAARVKSAESKETLLAAIRSLAAQQAKDEVREALEPLWQRARAPGADKIPDDAPVTVFMSDCREAARVLGMVVPGGVPDRALKTAATADQPGREGEGSDGWQPIETARKTGDDILVASGKFHPVRIAFWDTARGGLWSIWPGREPIEPTHWRPLPEPPSPAPRQDGEPEAKKHATDLALDGGPNYFAEGPDDCEGWQDGEPEVGA